MCFVDDPERSSADPAWLRPAFGNGGAETPRSQFTLVSGDLDEPAMDQYVFSTGRQPVPYLQCYDLTAWNSGSGRIRWERRGIDLFIGEPDMIERGHGSALVRCLSMIGCKKALRVSSRILIPANGLQSV